MRICYICSGPGTASLVINTKRPWRLALCFHCHEAIVENKVTLLRSLPTPLFGVDTSSGERFTSAELNDLDNKPWLEAFGVVFEEKE